MLLTSLPRKNHVDIRFTDDECARLERFMAAHGLNRSQAVRSLINLALDGVRANDGAALSKQVYREGYDAAVYDLKNKIGKYLASSSEVA